MQCERLLIFAKNKRAKYARHARLRRQATQGELILLNGTLRAALQNLSVCGRGKAGERRGGGTEGDGWRERPNDLPLSQGYVCYANYGILIFPVSPFQISNFLRNCGAASVGDSNMKIWFYQTS